MWSAIPGDDVAQGFWDPSHALLLITPLLWLCKPKVILYSSQRQQGSLIDWLVQYTKVQGQFKMIFTRFHVFYVRAVDMSTGVELKHNWPQASSMAS